MRITFLGGAGTVTGSRYLLENSHHRVLIDCGLFQGVKDLRLRNWDPFPIPPSQISAVFLTHAHVDHSGYLPRLFNEGFRGPVYCTSATADLCHIILMDSAKLQEEEALFANRHRYSKHHPALPLYTAGDVHQVLAHLRPVEWKKTFETLGFAVDFHRAGHILGAASIRFSCEGTRITFSGDIGRPHDPVMIAPDKLEPTDYLITESTYGDRAHPKTDPGVELRAAVDEIYRSGGALIIPAFTVGRTQQVLFELAKLEGAAREVPIFLDSPMAQDVTDLYLKHLTDHRLSRAVLQQIGGLVKYVRSVEESKRIDAMPGPRVIISASGMATGGRVLYHLEALASDPRTRVIFVGFQAAGTRGASLVAGAQEIKMHGHYTKIAARIDNVESLSAHADYIEIIEWLRSSQTTVKHCFVAHGEPAASDALRRRLNEQFGWPCTVPRIGDSVDLATDNSARLRQYVSANLAKS